MADEPGSVLGATLAALLHAEHVTISHVMRYSGLSRNTIKYILIGKTIRPKARTLTLIARAIATDSYTRERDRRVMTETERKLAIAAGYADPTAREARSLLELSLYYFLASRETASAWLAVIEQVRRAPAATVRRVPSLLATLGARPDDDVGRGPDAL